MKVTAWNNGDYHSTGAGYGLRIEAEDRDRYFQKTWSNVFVSLPGLRQKIEINIEKQSFWDGTCRELINEEIGKWLILNGYAPWPSGRPPTFRLAPTHANHFELRKE